MNILLLLVNISVLCVKEILSIGLEENGCVRYSNINHRCKNVYFWRKEAENYTTSSNITCGTSRKPPPSLDGKSIRLLADNMRPYIISNNSTSELSGYLGDIWNIVQAALKFESNMISVDFDTALELLKQNRADILLAAGVENPKLLHIEYSQPYFYNWYYLYIKRPEAKASSTSYIKTFQNDLWVATCALLTVLTVSLWITSKFLHMRGKRESNISIVTCLLIVCGGFLNQGFDMKVKSYSARIQVFLAFLIGYLLYSAMNAVLVARLAILEIELPYKSLPDIAERRTHSLCLRTNSFVYNNFTYANKTILPTWRGILNGPGCLDINDQSNLARILCKNGLIFLENRVVMSTVIQYYDIPCQMTFLNKRYFEKSNSFLFLKWFKGKHVINSFIKKMKSSGVLDRLEQKWIKKDQPVDVGGMDSPVVTINHVRGILELYFGLIIICMLILLCEIICERWKTKNVIFVH